ncbi:LysR family transcriptional regulator [Pseudonocardiaceae bacterium YIM PH 21723]|nr:LysR family transcriptional regulator [Pseudonocardiaceae bacterium YIM PH 21723]
MDLNLLITLDVLLQEHSVTLAAERLATSPAAVSRKLATLRRITEDPLLVRAGQHLVPTPRAEQLRERVRALVEQAGAVLAPGDGLDPGTLRRTFTVQMAEGMAMSVATTLLRRIRESAPGVEVVFLSEAFEDTPALRHGQVDVELGVLGHLDPETRSEQLIDAAPLAMARSGHPLFDEPVDLRRFAAAEHISVSRKGKRHGPIDAALAEHGLSRRVPVVVPSHLGAMMLALNTDLVGLTFAGALLFPGLRAFPLPISVPSARIGMAWHPRHDADPGQRWFRDQLRVAVTGLFG